MGLSAKGRFSLYLRGPARLELTGEPVALRRKGLALLYILALEGPTRRERIADLLWGHGGAANNLRVELHRLRRSFAEHGASVFDDGLDPLTLPATVTLETRGTAEILEGLEDLTPEFSEWLVTQRANQMLEDEAPTPERMALLDELLERVRAPFVLVVRVRPGSSAAPLARSLAARMKLPFVMGAGAGGPALHLLAAEEAPELWRTVANDDVGVWVVERSSLGDDPPLLLTLRSRLPADRLSYLELPPASWWEARQDQLAGLTFSAAARTYLASGGHRGYLQELAALPPSVANPDGNGLPLPQRIRAAYLLEAQRLSAGARHALERLSVLPGPYAPEFLERVGATEHLDELERLEWLSWDESWSFTDPAARTVLHASLQSGRRRRYEEATSAFLTTTANMPAAQTPAAHTTLPQVLTGLGRPFTSWSGKAFGHGVKQQGRRFTLVRLGNSQGSSGFTTTQLTDEPLLLHLRGHAHAPSGGAYGEGLPLRLRPGARREAVYLATLEAQAGIIDHWFYLENPSALRVECPVAEAVLDFELAFYVATDPAKSPRLAYAFAESDGYHAAWPSGQVEDADKIEVRRQAPS